MQRSPSAGGVTKPNSPPPGILNPAPFLTAKPQRFGDFLDRTPGRSVFCSDWARLQPARGEHANEPTATESLAQVRTLCAGCFSAASRQPSLDGLTPAAR